MPRSQSPQLEIDGPIWDDQQLLKLADRSTLSTGHVLRHHNQELTWHHVGYGYYEASRGRPSAENENIANVVTSSGANSELSFVMSFESEEVIETHSDTKTIAVIQALDPGTTTFSPTEISFLHLVIGWQYYTQTGSVPDSIEQYLSHIIRELRTRRMHAQILLPRFLNLVREAQYQMSIIWPEDTSGLTQNEQESLTAERAALHLRATRDMESADNIGGIPFDWRKVERGFQDVQCKEIIRGRPVLSMESTPEIEVARPQRKSLKEWSRDINGDCPLAFDRGPLMMPALEPGSGGIGISEVGGPGEDIEECLSGTEQRRVLPTPSTAFRAGSPDASVETRLL